MILTDFSLFSLFLEMVSLALKGQHLTEHNFVDNGFELHSSCLFKNGCSNDLINLIFKQFFSARSPSFYSTILPK